MNRKKLLSLLLCVMLLVTAITGCGGGNNNSGATNSGGGSSVPAGERSVLYHSHDSQPYVTLDPSVENSNGVMVLQNTHETLTRYNYKTGEIEPLLATSWTSNEDGTVWVFQIREGVKFHDGAEMNAEAVKKSIDRTITLNQGAAFIWDAVDSIEVTGDYEVTFNLSYPAAMDLVTSAAYAAYIISPNAIENNTEWFNDGNNSGTGPYMIQKLTPGEEVIFERFDDYWQGWSENQFTNVIVKKNVESGSRRQLIETGEAHISYQFSSTDLQALRDNPNVDIIDAPTFNNIMICLNTERPPMDNADFRRAMSYAFPYDETVNDVLEGNGKQSFGMVPDGLWAHDESLPQYKTDLEKAQEYLDKSGVDTNGLKIELTMKSGDDAYRNLAQLYQVNLKKLGIELELREMNWESQWERAKNTDPTDRQHMFIFIWWPDYASPSSWFNSMVKSEEEILFNLSYINDPEFDQMIAEADELTVTDRPAAEQKFIDIQKRLIDESLFLFLYDQVHVWAVNPSISGVEENPAYPTAIQYYNVTRN